MSILNWPDITFLISCLYKWKHSGNQNSTSSLKISLWWNSVLLLKFLKTLTRSSNDKEGVLVDVKEDPEILSSNIDSSSFEEGGQYESVSSERKKELMNYNVVVDPTKVYCIDFCVNTYTRTDPNAENFGEFKDENKLSSYVSSKCAECININYDRLKLLKNPYQQVDCTKQV